MTLRVSKKQGDVPTRDDEITIRLGRTSDLQACRLIENDAAGIFEAINMSEIDDDSPSDIATLDEASRDGRLWLACDDDDVPVGFAYTHTVDDCPHIQELAVLRAWQRRGIGARLIEAIARAARQAGAEAVTLTTFGDVPWNGPYYARLGFRTLSEDELSAALREILAEEKALGLDVTRRIAMRLDLCAPTPMG